jgi:hypothetical protein
MNKTLGRSVAFSAMTALVAKMFTMAMISSFFILEGPWLWLVLGRLCGRPDGRHVDQRLGDEEERPGLGQAFLLHSMIYGFVIPRDISMGNYCD